jgi:hypothetical protein
MSLSEKLCTIFCFENSKENNLFTVLKRETIIFLNKEQDIRNVDYKSMGVFFGLSFYRDKNTEKYDALLYFRYNPRELKRFLYSYLLFLFNRGRLFCAPDLYSIVKKFANDELDIASNIRNINDKLLFTGLIRYIWTTVLATENTRISQSRLRTQSTRHTISGLTSTTTGTTTNTTTATDRSNRFAALDSGVDDVAEAVADDSAEVADDSAEAVAEAVDDKTDKSESDNVLKSARSFCLLRRESTTQWANYSDDDDDD